MRKILKMDGYLLLKHWKTVFWLFFLFCTVGGAFSFWMIRGRGSGDFIQINDILAEMLFLAGSFLVPLSLICVFLFGGKIEHEALVENNTK